MDGQRVVCFGEALVDLFCERPVEDLSEAREFVPRAGGSLANIAVAAARFGAEAALLGGAGDDDFGRWLRNFAAAEGVGVEHYRLSGGGTAHAFVAISEEREPSFAFFGGDERPGAAAADDIEAALAGALGLLVVGSDTIIEVEEREVTRRLLALARERGWTVLCDPNLRHRRWPDRETMLATTLELIETSDVVKCNDEEAMALADADDELEAASSLSAGRVVAVTRGAAGAALFADGILVGEVEAPVTSVVDATGAGDAVAGILAAALSAGAEPAELLPALRLACAVAAGVTLEWGATEGLPPAGEAQRLLRVALDV